MILFEAISVNVNETIIETLVIYGVCTATITTMYLVETKKSIVENIAPILAKLFSPLLLIQMVAFLTVMVGTENSPFVDRNFLIAFDVMLVLVLGMVLYIISARKMHETSGIYDYINVALIATALVIDGVALTAIVFRLSEFGVTPNKLAALGENIVLLGNLVGLLWLYIRYFRGKNQFIKIEKWQTAYLTVYAVWMAIVVFLFPIFIWF